MTYYSPLETNVLCIILLSLIMVNGPRRKDAMLLSHRIYKKLLWCTILFCVVDVCLYHANGQVFIGSRPINEILNIIYIEMTTVLAYVWSLYVLNDVGSKILADRRKIALWSVPFGITVILCLIEPVTHFQFVLDETNLYHRADGLIINWIISWAYLFAATVLSVIAIMKEKNKLRRKELYPIVLFAVPPAITCCIQMIFYGFSLIQVGVLISLEMNFLNMQSHRILTDELTGLNNRRGLQSYIDERLRDGGADSHLFVLMMDIDKFKQINDKYGHTEGDHALLMASDGLKSACGSIGGRLYLSRYGGDEFVIVGYEHPISVMKELIQRIEMELKIRCEREQVPYEVQMSIGSVFGHCGEFEDIDSLMRIADKAMYQVKNERQAGR